MSTVKPNAAQLQQIAIYEKKLNQYEEKLLDLGDEFAANDDGDIELRDVHTFIMDAIKLIQMEIESSNLMSNFVLSTFVKEYTDYAKQAKKLSKPSSLIQPLDILQLFSTYLKQNAARINLIDLIATKAPQKPAPQQSKPPPQQMKPPQKQQEKLPEKSPTKKKEEEYGSEYEEIEEEFEEEMEEENEEEVNFDDVDQDLLDQPAKKDGPKKGADESPNKKPKQEQQKVPAKQQQEEKKQLDVPKKEVKKKQLLFSDDVETNGNQWETGPQSRKPALPDIILPDNMTEDNNLFNGIEDQSPTIPNPKQNKSQSPNLNAAARGKNAVPTNNQKLAEELLQLATNMKKQKTLKNQEQQKSSLLNMDKYLLDDQDTYRSPGLLDEVPDYIRQISSVNYMRELQDPQIQDMLQNLQRQITIRNDPNYDERMMLDKDLMDSDSEQQKKPQDSSSNTLMIPKRRESSNIDKTNSSGRSSGQGNHQQFSLTPMRNPTSDSVREERIKKRDEERDKLQINIDMWKGNSPKAVVKAPVVLQRVQRQYRVIEKPVIEYQEMKVLERCLREYGQITKQAEFKVNHRVERNLRIFDRQQYPVIVYNEFSIVMRPQREFGTVPSIQKQVQETKSWFATVSVLKCLPAKGTVSLSIFNEEEFEFPFEVPQIINGDTLIEKNIDQTETDLKIDQPEIIPELEKIIEKQITPAIEEAPIIQKPETPHQTPIIVEQPSIAITIMKAFTDRIQVQNLSATSSDHWFDTVIIKKSKPFFDKASYEFSNESEKIIEIIKKKSVEVVVKQPPLQSETIVNAPKVPSPKYEEIIMQIEESVQSIFEKKDQEVMIQESQVVISSTPTYKVEQAIKPKEEKSPEKQISPKVSISKPKEPIPRVISKKQPTLEKPTDEEIEEKQQKIDLIEIRKDANRKWKREQDAIEKEQPASVEQVIELKPEQPKKIAKRTVKIADVPPQTEQKFAEQLRQSPKPKQAIQKPKKVEQVQEPPKIIVAKEPLKSEQTTPLVRKLSIKQPLKQELISKTIEVPQNEDKGNLTDTSPERKPKLAPTSVRTKLVRAIQLYENMLSQMDESPKRKANMIQAVNDLKDQLKSMDKTSIHYEEFNSAIQSVKSRAVAGPKFSTMDETRHNQVSLATIKSPRSPSTNPFGSVESKKAKNNSKPLTIIVSNQDVNQTENPVIDQIQQENMELKYDENAKKTIDQLRIIFNHYSKQNLSIKMEYTFEDIKEDQGLLNISKVTAFIRDFEISVPPLKVSEVFKKCALQSRVMQFQQFQEFLEKMYLRQFETESDNVKRKILLLNFKLKKTPSDEPLLLEKQKLKVQLKELSTRGVEINQVYKQIREDLKLDDPNVSDCILM